MKKQKLIAAQKLRRQRRVRRSLRGTPERPRLSVHRSGKHISAQIIDDETGKTLVSASTMQKTVRDGLKSTSDKAAATKVGKALAELAKSAGIAKVCFDRGGFRYHGRVAALADGAREGGLEL
ncbi:MAG TPA: 50S ribosomal protein L18 [Planctomycetia bacterium]|nr:50S ribosomal protein L18 [Planctomycetia bacterium]